MDSESERAIRLIEVNASGKYVLSEEGKAFISKIQGPIAVISVAGMYRTGKSYLLNRMLLNRSNGFGVGPTVNPCTKGLWCWGKTIVGKTAEGQSINVIVIDTEGIGALDQDQTHDTRIFTLAILSASAFIYNSTGSIDENALQNLSLVVNLTKSIQLNTSKSEQEQDDPEELAEYFPAFYWVVRDFSLQLISTDGNQISPKQYLERALAPQKGFSDDVEEKNRIRRLLSSFFKQRECFTLVRPLVDEKKLQNLDQLEMDQLRPEFVDQVMNFRRRILGRVKPKVFKGKQLDGPMYLCLLNSYVTAINNGAVPNIENAWNYMCQQKCAHAFEQSVCYFNEQFDKIFKNMDLTGIDEQLLVEQIKIIKEKACDLFQVNAVGDRTKFHLKELREKLQHKSELIRLENEKISENALKSYFKKAIQPIENKLRLKEYTSFEDFMKELNEFYINLLENGPLLPKKQAVYLVLLKKVIPTAAELFLKGKTEQYKNLKTLSQQKQTSFTSVIESLKKQIKESEERSKDKVTKLQRQKIDLQFQLDDLRKTVEETRQKNTTQVEKLQTDYKTAIDGFKKKQQALNQKITSLNAQISQIQNELVTLKCSHEKQSALVTLKNKQLQTEIDELKKKQNQTVLSLRSLQASSSESIRNITDQYQTKIKDKDLEIRQLKVSTADLDDQIKTLQHEITRIKTDSQDEISKTKSQLNKKQLELIRISKEKEGFEKQIKESTQTEVSKLKTEVAKAVQKLTETEKQLKTINQSSSSKERSYTTELSLLTQKLQFAELEASEYKIKLTQAVKDHEIKIASLLEQNHEKQNQSGKLEEQAQLHEQRVAQLKLDHEQSLKKLTTQTEDLLKQVTELQLELKTTKSRYQIQIEEQTTTIKELREQLEGQSGDTSDKIFKMGQQFKVREKSYLDKIEKLEAQIEQVKEQMEREQREQREKSEQFSLQLKNYYEIEKDKLESKIISEKDKYERRISQLKADLEQRNREETMELEAQYECLKQRFGEVEEQLQKQRTSRKNEIDIKNKHIENLQKMNEQFKSKVDNKQVELLNKIERIQKQHSVEKQSLYAKMEELFTKQNKIEKEKTSLAHTKEQLEKMLAIRQNDVEQLKAEITSLKNKIQADKQLQKNVKNDISTKLMYERVEFEKKIALLSQQNTHLMEKIEENQKYILNHQATQEDKFRKLKQDYGHELRASRQKSQLELETIEAKYEKIKKAGKEKEATLQKSLSQLEKQLAIVTQKNISLSDKLKTYEEKQFMENEQYSSNLTSMKSSLTKQKQQLKQQLENQQRERERIQTEKNSLYASYQQQKLLMENRIKFIEQTKQRNKKQYQETKNKLELALEANKKRLSQEKANLELTHSEYIAKMQKKHWQEKQQVSESIKKQEIEYENKIRTLETENRLLNEKLASEQQNKLGSQNASDRRLKEVTQNQKKLQMELDRLKTMRECEQSEQQSQQRQKQNLKLKIKERDEKNRQLQKAKQHLKYEIEIQKSKWKVQKDNLITKAEQLKQLALKHQKQIEKLVRQNDKFKAQKKYQKSNMQSMTRFSSNFSIDRTSRSSLEESVLKQNSNNTSQISDSSIFFKE